MLINERLQNFLPNSDPVEIVSDEMMQAAVVSLGCFGVVYALEFYCEPAYDIAETRSTIEIPFCEEESSLRLPRILRSGIGVEPFEHETTDKASEPFVFSFFVNPHTDANNNLKCTMLDGKKQARTQQMHSSRSRVSKLSTKPPSESSQDINLGNTTCKCALCCITCGFLCERRGLNTTIEFIQTDLSAAALHAVTLFGSQSMVREGTTFSMYGFEHSMTRIDKWYEVLQITKGHIQ